MDAADGRRVADAGERLFSKVLLDVRSNMADQRLSSIRHIISLSVAQPIVGML